MRQLVITKCDSYFITKCDSYFITKCDKCYYKVRQVLQSATGITKCDDYHKSATEQGAKPFTLAAGRLVGFISPFKERTDELQINSLKHHRSLVAIIK